jgi:hypothetical protein
MARLSAQENKQKLRSPCLRQTEPRSPDRALTDKRIDFDRLAPGRNNGEIP